MSERCRMCGFPIVHDGHGLSCTGCAPEGSRVAAIAHLAADNERLRALVKEVETDAGECADLCPWCSGYLGKHAADCPAFTPDGKVK